MMIQMIYDVNRGLIDLVHIQLVESPEESEESGSEESDEP